MAKKKSYDETSVLRNLARRKGITFDYSQKIINVHSEATDVGNSTWGKIDYLTHYCGWFVRIVKNLNRKSIVNKLDDYTERPTKEDKHNKKINLVKQVKSIMKNNIKRK